MTRIESAEKNHKCNEGFEKRERKRSFYSKGI